MANMVNASSIEDIFVGSIQSIQTAWKSQKTANPVVMDYFDIELNFNSVVIGESSGIKKLFSSNDKKTETMSIRLATRIRME